MRLLFVWFLCANAFAQESYPLRLKAMMQARSAVQMESRLDRIDKTERTIRLCRAELRGEQVPVHCLRLSDEGLKNMDSKRPLVSRLCRKAVARLETVSEIHSLLSSLRNDKDCFEAANQRKLRLEYMHPELMIESDSDSPLR